MQKKETKKAKKIAKNLHEVKMKSMLEDSIKVSDPNRNYIKINNKKIDDIIKENAEKMLTINGEIDPANIVNNHLLDLNLLSLYDSNNNLINYDLEGVRKGKEYWENQTDEYIKILQDRLNTDLSSKTLTDLQKLVSEYNKEFLTNYVVGIKSNALDLADNTTQLGYANRLANSLTDLQAQEIQKIGIEKFLKLDLDKKPYLMIYYMDKDTLKNLQKGAIKTYNNTDKEYNYVKKNREQITFDSLINDILVCNIGEQIRRVKELYKSEKKFYDNRHKKRKIIDKLLIDVSKKYKQKSEELNKYANAVAPKQAQNKQINLHLAKIFNNTYPLNKYTSIDKNHNEKYDIKLKVSIDDEFKELRDIIFVDDINNKQISLLPIDLALFIGFTAINNINGGNIPITLTDAFKFISENKNMRIRKGQKAYQLYDERMQLFKSFKVKSIIKEKDTNKTLIEFKDAIPILENYKVHIASRKDMGYIIGASAILSILNFISEYEGVDYLATFSTANNYINDSQSSTIAILNMKYYIVIKILQMNNSSKNDKVYNPHINLDDLYKQTALLKNKKELTKVEKGRVREEIEIYLNHLKSKNLLKAYDYTPFKEIATKDSNKLSNASKSDLYIKL